MTSAAFNELDRQVLRGYGDAVAFATDFADGADELLIEASLAASVLDMECASADGATGARMALYPPNNLRAVVWISAAKRVAMTYVAVVSSTASSSLANRLADTGAALLLTSEALVPMVAGAFQLMETPPKGLLVGASLTRLISSPAAPLTPSMASHMHRAHSMRLDRTATCAAAHEWPNHLQANENCRRHSKHRATYGRVKGAGKGPCDSDHQTASQSRSAKRLAGRMHQNHRRSGARWASKVLGKGFAFKLIGSSHPRQHPRSQHSPPGGAGT